ncbi:hypothetical protein H2O64_17400 [Kordia sp. YSTF-M3]|uniref:Uncharacterized protein n=1 Tax=Kordia aestuariivivens TaxID=2759037 RepID=A0ABR7QDQ9_9FLAO|nr:hypothetical protein [Kordia aestuariivivens]MBC8756454.1 hypothetical protein [Kordia aestuariivivens]
MKTVLVDEIPLEFKDCLPINVFFIEGKEVAPIKRSDLTFVASDFYTTDKMRCYDFYKPAFL